MAARERNESQINTDITIYGATSFVARHVLNYMVELGSSSSLPRKLKVTLAGRNESKLQKVLDNFRKEAGDTIALDVVVANSTDHDALKKMTSRSRVVLNCAGPFELYSSGVVGACAEMGCDYVDITGEVGWVGNMRVKYGSESAKSGARIISLCGFDSVPSDLAIFAAVQALKKTAGVGAMAENIEVARTWHACVGMAGGGTLATMKNMEVDWAKCLIGRDGKPRNIPLMLFDPLVLTHPESVRFNPDYNETRDRLAWKEWLNCLPFPHSIFQQGVSIPFFMAVANAKVVQASAMALNYGPRFTYQERWLPMGFKKTLGFGLFSTIPSLIMLFFTAVAGVIVMLPVVGDLLLKWFAPPGTGASDAMCKSGYAQVYSEVKAPIPNQKGRVACANAFLEFEGDPGNWVTAQCVTESALALVFSRKELPTRSKDGFGTPAELLGPVLLKRLQESKVRPLKVKTNVRANERDHEYKVYLK